MHSTSGKRPLPQIFICKEPPDTISRTVAWMNEIYNFKPAYLKKGAKYYLWTSRVSNKTTSLPPDSAAWGASRRSPRGVASRVGRARCAPPRAAPAAAGPRPRAPPPARARHPRSRRPPLCRPARLLALLTALRTIDKFSRLRFT